jgi:3-oxoadipate CoA-transferase beta subunit
VSRIYTDLAVIDVTPQGLKMREVVDGLSFDALVKLTGVSMTLAKEPAVA